MAFFHVDYPFEPPPIYWDPNIGWQQGGHPMSARWKPKHEFVWPKDGKRRNKRGRLADILTGKGPDVFVSTYGDRREKQFERPTRDQWSGWDYLGDPWRMQEIDNFRLNPFLKRRNPNKKYNFRNRKYGWGRRDDWTDVRWQEGAKTSDRSPMAKRNVYGEWFEQQDPNWWPWGGIGPPPMWW
ncbi:MAG: hypothetical protein M1820_008781 [Bogoriella megaspora]|nr:MAG: hypothetical protein M1820_008781 [Bogoriella megaspora]